MSLCWSCATKALLSQNSHHLSIPLRRLPKSAKPLRTLPQKRHFRVPVATVINDSSFPPPEFGNIRERLAEWQATVGSKLTDPATAEYESKKLQGFAASSGSLLDPQDDLDRTNADIWKEDFGEAGAVQERHYIAPGSLVEVT
jgi:hypothetical protein